MDNREEVDSLGDRIAEHAAHLDAATHRLLTDLRTFDQAGGWSRQGAKSFGAWLAWRVGWDGSTAREHVRVATKLGGLPLIDEALRRGEMSYSKVRAMTRVATPENEAMLLEQARYSTGAQLDRICRKYATVQRHDDDVQPEDDQQRRYVQRRDTADGMVKIEAVLHPEEAAIVWAALERIASERCRAREAEPDDVRSAHTERGRGATADDGRGAIADDGRGASAEAVRGAIADDGRDAFAEAFRGAPVGDGRGASAEAVRGEIADDGRGAFVEAAFADGPRASAEADEGRAARPRRPVKPFDRAEALVAIGQEILRGTRRDRAPTDLVVAVTADALSGRTEAVDVGVVADGTCVSAAAARRIACDCGVTHVVEDERGVPLSIGRKRRTIPGTMKRALLRRDRTCRFPGCAAHVFLEGHHAEHWADGGETKLSNIVSLCGHHHRYVHEYGFMIRFDDLVRGADGELRFVDPFGRVVLDVPERPVVHGAGWPAIFDGNAMLGITSDTSVCEWDGGRVDYPAVVDALVFADRAGA